MFTVLFGPAGGIQHGAQHPVVQTDFLIDSEGEHKGGRACSRLEKSELVVNAKSFVSPYLHIRSFSGFPANFQRIFMKYDKECLNVPWDMALIFLDFACIFDVSQNPEIL